MIESLLTDFSEPYQVIWPKKEAKTIRVKIRSGKAGLLFATSSDLDGLLVAEKTLFDIRRAIPQAIRNLYLVRNIIAVVIRKND